MPEQTYATHRRVHRVFHFVVFPILFINFVVMVVLLARNTTPMAAWNAIVAAALMWLSVIVRGYATRNQDRIIRLEEQVRLSRSLPEDLRARIPELTTGQLVALRFCTDGELPELTRAVLSGDVKGRENIKKRIKTWRPDTLRV